MAVSYGKRSDRFLLQRSRVCPWQNREAGTSGNWKSCLIHCTNFIPSCLSSLHPPCWCQSHNCCLLFSLQVISDSLRPHGLQHIRLTCPSPSPGVCPKLISIALVMPCNHLILCHPFLLLPSIFPSIRVFSNESAVRIRWPKYWSFGFSISPSNEYSGLISFILKSNSSSGMP